MEYKHILYEERERIGVLTLNEPEKRNALGIEFEREITACLKDAAERKNAKVIIIKAAGEVFCSGHDRTEILRQDLNDVRRLFQTSIEMMMLLRAIPQPVIAQVQGIAMAGGCHLVAACDLVVAAERGAQFAMTGVKIGYNCSTPTVAVSRAIGQKRTLEMLFTGRFISAREALAWGLVNRVAPDESLDEETWSFAKEIAQHSSVILGLGKQAYYQQIEMPEAQAYHYAKELMGANALMADAVEGMSANIEKREPTWIEK